MKKMLALVLFRPSLGWGTITCNDRDKFERCENPAECRDVKNNMSTDCHKSVTCFCLARTTPREVTYDNFTVCTNTNKAKLCVDPTECQEVSGAQEHCNSVPCFCLARQGVVMEQPWHFSHGRTACTNKNKAVVCEHADECSGAFDSLGGECGDVAPCSCAAKVMGRPPAPFMGITIVQPFLTPIVPDFYSVSKQNFLETQRPSGFLRGGVRQCPPECTFPFKYNGVWYNSCTTASYAGLIDDSPWCATAVDKRRRYVSGEYTLCPQSDLCVGQANTSGVWSEWKESICQVSLDHIEVEYIFRECELPVQNATPCVGESRIDLYNGC